MRHRIHQALSPAPHPEVVVATPSAIRSTLLREKIGNEADQEIAIGEAGAEVIGRGTPRSDVTTIVTVGARAGSMTKIRRKRIRRRKIRRKVRNH